MSDDSKLYFASDYMEGAHPKILERLMQTNFIHTVGYGEDRFSEHARELIRKACAAPQAEIHFLAGGTQTNATVIDALLKPWQGVLSADSGHINAHEAGAIEAGGHKVLTLPAVNGKLRAGDVQAYLDAYSADANRAHCVAPGMVYISQPTETGTLYSLKELEDLSAVCRRAKIPLYADGARLAYALACSENDAGLPDLARLCDAFYIGGTKCGALLGEAVVFPRPDTAPHFFTIVKQHGALLAKGRVAAIQFEVLFTDGLYMEIGKPAIAAAARIREALKRKGYALVPETPTNQIFVRLDDEKSGALSESVVLSFWERVDERSAVWRIATSWATADADVDRLISLL